MRPILFTIVLLFIFSGFLAAQSSKTGTCTVIAYYDGDADHIDQYPVEKLTHIIYSFCHLKGNKLSVDNARDTATIQHLVALKKRNPGMKVILSMGGWSACGPCSLVFSDDANRKAFAASAKELMDYFHTDGLDLDWEYPAIEGYPGHRFVPEDREHFTALVQRLRTAMGKKLELSFAAGGFKNYYDSSINWSIVMPLVNRVNLMSYDLVGGYATRTGNHTPLYSTPEQPTRSIDYGVHYLDSLGVPLNKITIGAAFYARIFENADSTNHGMYQSTRFKQGMSYKNIAQNLTPANGFIYYWDDVAKAPYMYNAAQKLFVTYDDTVSIRLKTQYAIDKKLDGIMFWQLGDDSPSNGLLDVIYDTKKKAGQ